VKPKAPYDRATKTSEVYRLLNDYVGDLCAGKFGLITFETSPQFATASDGMKMILRRMCLSHLVLTLSKLENLLDNYKAMFSSDVRDAASDLKKELARKGVRSFRNAAVAHYREKKHKRPLTGDEIEERLDPIVGDGFDPFLSWIDTVVATCERIRDRLDPRT